ncbi:MAG: DUF2461 domain-containing protein [Byssovorax sp.]
MRAMPSVPSKTTSKRATASDEAKAGFAGFADTQMKFFKALAKHQDRDWFAKNKGAFEEGWSKPMALLLDEARAKIDGAYPDCDLEAPKVFRLHRDVRFSSDKSPYKTNVSGVIAARKGLKVTEAPAALYVQLGEECIVGAGLYMMDAGQLAKYRAAVLDDAKGKELDKIVKGLEKKGFSFMAGGELKSAPRGVDPAHPRIELLKKKGLVAAAGDIPMAKLTSREFLDWVAAQGKLMAPLVRWLVFTTA